METSRKQMSAFMDGELDVQECDFLIRRMHADGSLRESWHRYHITRACMQREFAATGSLLERVRDALADAQSGQQKRGDGSSWLRTGLGGALAASVALVAIVGLNTRLGPIEEVDLLADRTPGFVSQSTPMDRQFNRQAVPVGLGNLPVSAPGHYFSPSQIAARPFTEPRARINRYMTGQPQPLNQSVLPYTPIPTTAAEAVEAIPTNPVSSVLQVVDEGGGPD